MDRVLRPLLLLGILVASVLAVSIGCLVATDRSTPGSPAQRQAHDILHFWGHLLAGRTLTLTPGMRHHASGQYYRAAFHARTPHQRALLGSERPHSLIVDFIKR
jgi:hypothetical protein